MKLPFLFFDSFRKNIVEGQKNETAAQFASKYVFAAFRLTLE